MSVGARVVVEVGVWVGGCGWVGGRVCEVGVREGV